MKGIPLLKSVLTPENEVEARLEAQFCAESLASQL